MRMHMEQWMTDDSQNIRTRKQSKEASDKIHQANWRIMSQLQSTGKYAVDHKEMTVDHLNVLNNLYGFKNSTLTSPSKLPGWLEKCKKGSKNASD